MDHTSQQAAQAIQAQRQAFAVEIVARQARLQPYSVKASPEKSVRDAGYHLDYLAETLHAGDLNLFLDYVGWVRELFSGLKFPVEVLPTTLRCTSLVLKEALPSEFYQPARLYLEAGQELSARTGQPSASFLQPDQPHTNLAFEYLAALLRLDSPAAGRLIQAASEQGVTIHEIYLHIFQPVLRDVGRLWQTNQISVAMEHFCTAATQLYMSQFYPQIFGTPKIGRRLLAACVGSELHEIGIRMVCDFFAMEGWNTIYLGANTPTPGILRMLDEQKTDVLAISTTITTHVGQVADLVARVRSSGSAVKILVGGYPFNISPNLWQSVGADGYARDAQQAIASANALLASSVS